MVGAGGGGGTLEAEKKNFTDKAGDVIGLPCIQ